MLAVGAPGCFRLGGRPCEHRVCVWNFSLTLARSLLHRMGAGWWTKQERDWKHQDPISSLTLFWV